MKTNTKKQQPTTMIFENYVIKVCDCVSDRYDLYPKSETSNKNKPKAIGYGYRYDEVLMKIAAEKLSRREDISTIKEYHNEYKKAVAEIRQTLAV